MTCLLPTLIEGSLFIIIQSQIISILLMKFHSFSGIIKSGLLMLHGAFLGKTKEASFPDYLCSEKKFYKERAHQNFNLDNFSWPAWWNTGCPLRTWRLIRVCKLPGLGFAELSRFFSAALHCMKLFIQYIQYKLYIFNIKQSLAEALLGWCRSEWFLRVEAMWQSGPCL